MVSGVRQQVVNWPARNASQIFADGVGWLLGQQARALPKKQKAAETAAF